MAIWVIITTSLINGKVEGRDYITRKTEYMTAIPKILQEFKGYNIVIVENQSILSKKVLNFLPHKTFLDEFNIPVLYTKTNEIKTINYGKKELLDILACIKHFNIQDEDFIVKITGRYMLSTNPISKFVQEVRLLSQTNYEAIVRYGSYLENPASIKFNGNCITGIIGLKSKYVKEIEFPDDDTFIEMKWAKKISTLDSATVCVLPVLGIWIRPAIEPTWFPV